MRVFIYCADVYCEACGEDIRANLHHTKPHCVGAEDSNHWPQGPYDNGGGEADTPQHCGGCQAFLENPLTADGVQYVAEKIAERISSGNRHGVAWRVWRPFYAEALAASHA